MSEQEFTIQPHPAKDNVPPPGFQAGGSEQTSGLGSAPNLSHLPKDFDPTGGVGAVSSGKGPHIISKEVAEGLEKPKTREELKAEIAKLNE